MDSFKVEIPTIELRATIDPVIVFQTLEQDLPGLIKHTIEGKGFDLTSGASPITQFFDIEGAMVLTQVKTPKRRHVDIPLTTAAYYGTSVQPGELIPVDRMQAPTSMMPLNKLETVLRAKRNVFVDQRMIKANQLFIFEGGRLPPGHIAEVYASQTVLGELRKERDDYLKRFHGYLRRSGHGIITADYSSQGKTEVLLPSTFLILMHGVWAMMWALAQGSLEWFHAPSKFCFCKKCMTAREA